VFWCEGVVVRMLRRGAAALVIVLAASAGVGAAAGEAKAAAPELSPLDRMIERLGERNRSRVRDTVLEIALRDEGGALPALRALADRGLGFRSDGRAYIRASDGGWVSASRGVGESLETGEKPRVARINNGVRRVLTPTIAQLELQSGDVEVRREAAAVLVAGPLEESKPAIERALERETVAEVRAQLESALAQLELSSPDPDVRLAAVRTIGDTRNVRMRSRLEAMLVPNEAGDYSEPDEQVRAAAKSVLQAFDRAELFRNGMQHLSYGMSLGSVLLLAALGLAITFGLMGVINMAHGEMLMLGAYSTFAVQTLINRFLPSAADWYLLLALPTAFSVAAAVGMLLERTVIRFLYGRPLETLLTTWGISLILIQTVRLIFGAQNVAVANPSWLSGGAELLTGVQFPYARIATVLFAGIVVLLVWALLQRTRLGLEVRAVTQNRDMAASMGISTVRVDMWTFGLGSGIAGLGGVALSQLVNVGPELGQSYIVDSFMVVVLGGVGKLVGTISGAMALGIVNKFLEPMVGAVFGKIALLVIVILVIQRRPEGIFALGGRASEG